VFVFANLTDASRRTRSHVHEQSCQWCIENKLQDLYCGIWTLESQPKPSLNSLLHGLPGGPAWLLACYHPRSIT